ncbi:MAG: glycosyltransferase [Planctomycetales bacterium]|nr:glycosyltransferase [Planctomycetales bacterium]
MKILMVTNTFAPHVGGVARSVQQFTSEYRQRGHEVLVVAPEFPHMPDHEVGVIRIPAVQRFNGSDFSVPVPIPGLLSAELHGFNADIVHTHHPFLLGDAALRIAAKDDIPIVFTHHTQYEQYTHYVPGDSETMKRFVVELAVGYCNLCDTVIAPSATIRQRLVDQGVEVPVEEIPTGVDTKVFGAGDGTRLRGELGWDEDDFIVGHVGRLAPEKRLGFLANAVARFVASAEHSRFLVAGDGPSRQDIEKAFRDRGIADRLVLLGTLGRSQLADVYQAMDVFAFASQSETQGMVLTEAMAAGTPVVAVDAPGVREVLRDGENGIKLPLEETNSFVDALTQVWQASRAQRERWEAGALRTAEEFSMTRTAERALALYQRSIAQGRRGTHGTDGWSAARRRVEEEWHIWGNFASAASQAVLGL